MRKIFLIISVLFVVQSFAYDVQSYDTVVKPFLSQYKHQFTLLEVYPAEHPFAWQMVRDLSGIAVLLEDAQAGNLMCHAHKNGIDRVVVLAATCTAADYQKLTECEHFDVVIIHDIHRLFVQGQLVTSLLSVGDYTVVAHTAADEQEAQMLKEYLTAQALDFYEVASTATSWLFIHNPRTTIIRKSWDAAIEPRKNMYNIAASFEKKEFIHAERKHALLWIPGINLSTFLALKGAYPKREWVKKKILEFKHCDHNDFWIGNLIIQGLQLRLIDFNDSRRSAKFRKHFKKVLKMFK